VNYTNIKRLKNETLHALFWSFAERFGQQGIQFITSILLARLLLPEDFGLIAMVYIIIAMGNSFIDSGFQKALIQKKELTSLDKSSVFYFNVFIAIIVSSIIFISAPLIGTFYNRGELIQIVRILSLVFLFSSFGLVQDALLARTLQFKQIFTINTLSSILAGTISIIMALNGLGVWSLVVLNIGSTLLRTIFLWLFSVWRPSRLFSLISLKAMFAFGSSLFFVSITNAIFTNLYQVLIGKFYSADSLGYYSRARNLSMYPVTLVTSVVSQVSFPVFSKLQNDENKLGEYVHKSLILLTIVTFPLMIGLIVISRPLILLLLTEKWLHSVQYFQLLCLVGMFYPIQVVNLNALNALGHSKKYLKIDFINKIIILLTVAFTFRLGIYALIFGQIINTFIAYYLSTYYVGKYIQYSFKRQILAMYPSLLASMTMGIIIYLMEYLIILNGILLMMVQVISGILIYITLCYLFRIPAFYMGLNIIKTVTKKSEL
jgi:teichuronic acid exporter